LTFYEAINIGWEKMMRIGLLKNTVQEYTWGSYTYIPELLGNDSPASTPRAELWMGAHPKAPSMVKCNGQWRSLAALIEKNPEEILGKAAAEKFDNRLPYLFKVLAAAKPLSIQAHPSLAQAREGFERENRFGIPLAAHNRNYKDDNHKPECICALTSFWALNGFRKVSGILSLMEKICPQGLKRELDNLQMQPNSLGLKKIFQAMMTMDRKQQKLIIADAVTNAQKFKNNDQTYKWMIDLHNEYPADIGVFAPILLNLICLKPGEAMFLPAGQLHAYLDGVGIELMANSDNVLRGGLTPKHVDVPELLNALTFEERELNILSKEEINECEGVYFTPAEEFILSIISVRDGKTYNSSTNRSVEILLCTNGDATITDLDKNDKIDLTRGRSIIIPAVLEKYRIEGKATLYKAAVPV
jgi:mannose-6-phosphate isomerase